MILVIVENVTGSPLGILMGDALCFKSVKLNNVFSLYPEVITDIKRSDANKELLLGFATNAE